MTRKFLAIARDMTGEALQYQPSGAGVGERAAGRTSEGITQRTLPYPKTKNRSGRHKGRKKRRKTITKVTQPPEGYKRPLPPPHHMTTGGRVERSLLNMESTLVPVRQPATKDEYSHGRGRGRQQGWQRGYDDVTEGGHVGGAVEEATHNKSKKIKYHYPDGDAAEVEALTRALPGSRSFLHPPQDTPRQDRVF